MTLIFAKIQFISLPYKPPCHIFMALAAKIPAFCYFLLAEAYIIITFSNFA